MITSSKSRRIIAVAFIVVCLVVSAVILFVAIRNKNGSGTSIKLPVSISTGVTTLFGCKTAYRFVANYDINVKKPPSCQPIQLNMVSRHGTRIPSESDIKKFNDLSATLNRLMKYNSSGKASSAVSIKFPWISPYQAEEARQLVDTGDQECYGIGQRFPERFPEILKQHPVPVRKFKFISTETPRTTQSAMAFAMGYLSGKGKAGPCKIKAVPFTVIPKDNNTLLTNYDFCPKYIKEVLNNKSTTYEIDKFLSGPYVTRTVNTKYVND